MGAMTLDQAFQTAVAHHVYGRLAEAEALYRQILAVQPFHFDALNNLGALLTGAGKLDEAVAAFQQITRLQPNAAAAFANLGNLFRDTGRLEEAVMAYRRAVQINPNLSEAFNGLGSALQLHQEIDEALVAYERAIQLEPANAMAQSNRGSALRALGKVEAAVAAFRAAVQLRPDAPWARSNLIYALLFHPGPDAGALSAELETWDERFGRAASGGDPAFANDRDPGRRLRVGYVSPNFGDHVVGRNLLPLFGNHDRRELEIFCYSGAPVAGTLTPEIAARADHWRSLYGLDDAAAAALIQRDRIDILVDLTQHMADNRLTLFARRPAPVQVSFAGYPEGTGLRAIGCRLSDHWLLGEGREPWDAPWRDIPRHGERVFLIDSFWCYEPVAGSPMVNALPAQRNGYVTFGSLNQSAKVGNGVLRLWARVMKQVAGSRLLLMCPRGSRRAEVLQIFAENEIAAPRIEFAERQAAVSYLELHHCIDVMLDPFPYGGHSTSLDALWMGVPVVSLAGASAVSRAGLSQLSNLGLPELVADSEDDYLTIAVRLASDLEGLAELRSTLRPRMEASVLMDGVRFARQIEQSYRAMWREWCGGS